MSSAIPKICVKNILSMHAMKTFLIRTALFCNLYTGNLLPNFKLILGKKYSNIVCVNHI